MSVMQGEECRVIADVTVTIRGVTLHHHDPPFVLLRFNPWVRQVRADQQENRVFNDGAWSGYEFHDVVTVPIVVLVKDPEARPGTLRWLQYHQQLAAAFAASSDDVELRFDVGGTPFLMFGRPRLVEPDAETSLRGFAVERCVFVATNPRILGGGDVNVPNGEIGRHEASTGLPVAEGGLTVPFTVPFAIHATVASGVMILVNAGTYPANLRIRIDGPVEQPRITLQDPDGSTATLRYHGTLTSGQWLDIDTQNREVLLNGTASRRGNVSGEWPLLKPGTSELTFNAASFNPDALLTVVWRDSFV